MNPFPNLFVRGQRVRLASALPIAEGGEACIYLQAASQGPPTTVLKVFKVHTHPDFQGDPGQQAAVRSIHLERQRRLPALLNVSGIPPGIVTPTDLVQNEHGEIIGCVLPRIVHAEPLVIALKKRLREAHRLTPSVRAAQLRTLHATVQAVHAAGVVIGDFSDKNVLGRGSETFIIDADTLQFPPYRTWSYTPQFVDPLHCDPAATQMAMLHPHSVASDWYAFAVIAFRALLLTDPYLGIHTPGDPAAKVASDDVRRLRRLSVFHRDVRYPKAAVPLQALPDALVEEFRAVFVQDARRPFPRSLLDHLAWSNCPRCGRTHARSSCPFCTNRSVLAVQHSQAAATPPPRRAALQLRARTIVEAPPGGAILAAGYRDTLQWLSREDGRLVREDGHTVLNGPAPTDTTHYFISGGTTILATRKHLLFIGRDRTLLSRLVGASGGAPLIDASMGAVAWSVGDALWCANGRGQKQIYRYPRIPSQRPRVGSTFGFLPSEPSLTPTAQLFDVTGGPVRPVALALPLFADLEHCVFSPDRCILFYRYGLFVRNRRIAFVVHRSGTVESQVEFLHGVTYRVHGACLDGTMLFCPTDHGIGRIDLSASGRVTTTLFDDTTRFLTPDARLVAGGGGLFVITRQSIVQLRREP